MSRSATVEWLTEAIGDAAKYARFCVSGCLPVVDPGIEVKGLGPIELPLKPKTAKALIACCRPAPYGKGTRTLVDKRVRNTFELDPGKFRLSDEWNAAIAGATQLAAEQLGLPAEQVEARLYKLLVYKTGGFFLKHRDSEKHDRMVASMIVALPNRFAGGELVVRHGGSERTLKFADAANGTAPCFAAFYADCEHEVRRVTDGVRLCLAYNLVLKTKRKRTPDGKPIAQADRLVESIRSWTANQPTTPLVFALAHHYTERGLSLDLLKGADRALAETVVSAAEKAGCLVYLAQVSRHLTQSAFDESYGDYWRRSSQPRGELEIIHRFGHAPRRLDAHFRRIRRLPRQLRQHTRPLVSPLGDRRLAPRPPFRCHSQFRRVRQYSAVRFDGGQARQDAEETAGSRPCRLHPVRARHHCHVAHDQWLWILRCSREVALRRFSHGPAEAGRSRCNRTDVIDRGRARPRFAVELVHCGGLPPLWLGDLRKRIEATDVV
ncbi:MAG TPA: 2OG-Fe(II) oxygenase [Pirellulales bacterium]|nr:2OG-Fe(II) oxygenase [Pirellulales bacterium]